MLALIIGGSGSGKSDYAEELICSIEGNRVYLATMKVSDDESRERVRRHRKLRESRQFTTIERTDDIGSLSLMPDSNVLLEDMGNLLANVMYGHEELKNDREIVDMILSDVMELYGSCRNLVIVTNDVFSEGKIHDEETVKYMKNLALINKATAERADFTAEIICGIPNILKDLR